MVEPTGYTALDLIGFTDRGDYDPSVYYVKNDLVHDGVDNIWRVLIDDTHGVTPAEGLNYTIFIRNHGTEAEEIIAPVESNPAAAAHAVGTQLIYDGDLYEVTKAIAVSDSLVAYPTSGYNIKAAGTVASQIQTLANDEQATRDSIAPTENGTNYSTSYNKGAQFYHNGELREVTVSSVNTSSVISTTSAPTNSITSQINDVEKVILSASDMTLPPEITLHGANANYYLRVGKIVALHISLKIDSSTKKAFTIENFIKISKDMPMNEAGGCFTDGESDGLMQYAAISNYGVLALWNIKTGVSYAQGTLTYIAKY